MAKRQRVYVRADTSATRAAAAPPSRCSAIAPACPARCWAASTRTSRSPRSPISCCGPRRRTGPQHRGAAARQRQFARAGKLNHALTPREISHYCKLEPQALQLLARATERLGLSARAYHRLIKVAPTIADLAEDDAVGAAYVSEAVAYRRLDRS